MKTSDQPHDVVDSDNYDSGGESDEWFDAIVPDNPPLEEVPELRRSTRTVRQPQRFPEGIDWP